MMFNTKWEITDMTNKQPKPLEKMLKSELIQRIIDEVNRADDHARDARAANRCFDGEKEGHKKTEKRLFVHRDKLEGIQAAIETIAAIHYPGHGLITGNDEAPIYDTGAGIDVDDVDSGLTILRHLYSLANTNVI